MQLIRFLIVNGLLLQITWILLAYSAGDFMAVVIEKVFACLIFSLCIVAAQRILEAKIWDCCECIMLFFWHTQKCSIWFDTKIKYLLMFNYLQAFDIVPFKHITVHHY